MFRNWMQLTHDAVLLGLESQRVMGLRVMKLSRGLIRPRPPRALLPALAQRLCRSQTRSSSDVTRSEYSVGIGG